MKKLITLCVLSVLFLFPSQVFAHLPGQEPFFKINNVYTPLYHVPSTSLVDFVLPQDSAPQPYLINTPIAFAIDKTKLPMFSDEALATMVFRWNFGDGQQAEGFEAMHTYTIMGSYILEIFVIDEQVGSETLLQSTLLHIIPDASYVVPKAVIEVNGKQSVDPLTNPLSLSFSQPVIFDASKSTADERIASYLWDFGDMQSGKKEKIQHSFNDELRIVFPVLRITDTNGFISDSFVQINNEIYEKQTKKESTHISFLPVIIGGILTMVGVIMGGTLYKKKRKTNKSKT